MMILLEGEKLLSQCFEIPIKNVYMYTATI
jgi:hypothetical protein